MSSREAIADSRKAYGVEGARWPAPLLAYIDRPPDDRRAFEWLCSCVGDLLDYLGVATDELKDALSFARGPALERADSEAIERRAWGLWSRRSAEGMPFTAVAQLLYALSRADRSDRRLLAGACSTPILLLERLEARPGEVYDRVVEHFSRHVNGDAAFYEAAEVKASE